MKSLKHLFVPYELALKLKEKGFNEPCLSYYFDDTLKHPSELTTTESQDKCQYITTKGILAPLYQQVIDWFLDKHKIYITEKANELLTHFSCKVWKSEKTGHTAYQQGKWTETYPYGLSRYEALDIAIEEALKLI